MDRKLGNNLVVGAFVLVGFAVFLFLIFNIGGGRSIFKRELTLVARYKDVKGLHYGSEVSLSGLRAGVVRDIKVAQDGSRELIVEMSITKSLQDKIRQDSTATIRTQGVLGDKYVEISIGNPELPMVEEGATLTTVAEADLFSKGGELVKDVRRHFVEGGDVDKLLKNANTFLSNLSAITYELRSARGGSSLGASMKHLDSILAKIDRGEGTLGALINDPTLFEDVKDLMGGAKRSSILKYFIREFVDEGKESRTKKSE